MPSFNIGFALEYGRLSKTGRRSCFSKASIGIEVPLLDNGDQAKGVNLKFAIGDWVVHQVHGVGTVKSLSEQQFVGGQRRQYYEVIMGGSTLWVPIDGVTLSLLRCVAPKQTVDECRQLLREEPIAFDENRTVRQVEIARRMHGGLLPALSRTVRDLRARAWTNPLTVAEDVLLSKLTKALGDEWAASAGISTHHALREIEGYLKNGRLVYAPELANTQSNRSRGGDWS